MKNNEYIPLKDFAERAGVSVQTIYNRIKTDLKPFLKTFKTGKHLHVKGLELFSLKDIKIPLKEVEEDYNAVVFEVLKRQLQSKDEQLKAKDEQIKELMARLEQSLKLNENSQVLLQNEQQKLLALDSPKNGLFNWSKKNKTS